MGWATMRTTQDVYLSFGLKEGAELKLTGKESREFNDYIAEAVSQNTVEGDIRDYSVEEGFSDSEHLTDGFDYDFTIRFDIDICGKYDYYPGSMYGRNGDPGDPPDESWEPDGGWIENLDKSKIISDILAIDKLGPLIEKDSIHISLRDYDPEGALDIDDDY